MVRGRGGRGGRARGRGGRMLRGRQARGRGAEGPAFPYLNKLFGPLQMHENDIPVILFDVGDGKPKYTAVMEAIKARQRDIAPEVVGDNRVPILPLPNPLTGPSHYIIRLVNCLEPRFMVDLLIRDTDQYFVAFRRHLILTDDERAATQAQGELGGEEQEHPEINEGPGTWYRNSNEKLPACLNTDGVSMGVNSSHRGDKTTPGGGIVLAEIFFTLSKFEDLPPGADEDALDKAVQRMIVIFCEATRFRSLYFEMARRFGENEEGSHLNEKLWALIHAWDVLSGKVLERRLMGQIGLGTPLPGLTDYGFDPNIDHTMASLIGPEGELMLILFDADLLIDENEKVDREGQVGSENVPEPNFPGHVLEHPAN